MLVMLRFLHYVESRSGFQLNDPLLQLIPPLDLNKPIFFLLYTGVLGGIAWLLPSPHKFMLAMEVYFVYAVFRILALWIVPLEPPEGIIPLADPILNYASTGVQINKDLFFSGHTATFAILYLTLPRGRHKILFLIGLILMALFLVIQRVHYTIDVIAAPVFSYAAFRLIILFRRNFISALPAFGSNKQPFKLMRK